MPVGELILAAYGLENLVLNEQPQITFFKIMYRRYTNFSIETVEIDFLRSEQMTFSKKYSVEIPKVGDLINKMWLVIELPEIPVIYNMNNCKDLKIKFKWTLQLAFAIINYVEIEINDKIIERLYGEYLNVLDKLDWNNFNSSLAPYIGDTPDLTTYQYLSQNFESKTLYVPLWFWFANNSTASFPFLCMEYGQMKFNVQFNDFQSCGIFSPSNYVPISTYYGNGILGEPLIQYSNQGIAWGEFDSVDIATYDSVTMNVSSFNLYYRKISENQFITSSNFANDVGTLLSQLLSSTSITPPDYFIVGLYSGAVFIPTQSDPNNASSIYIQRAYVFDQPLNETFKNVYLLASYIFIDREERKQFYSSKHEYLVEQVSYSNPRYLVNLNNKNSLELINPCKYIFFMAQVKYFTTYNVNYLFNYNLYFFDLKRIKPNLLQKYNLVNSPVVNQAYFSFNASRETDTFDMKFYSTLLPFLYYPMATNNIGFGIKSFSLYPDESQPSGSCNMSYFSTCDINTTFNPIDIDYNNYIFKSYSLSYNYLIVANGVVAPKFNSPF